MMIMMISIMMMMIISIRMVMMISINYDDLIFDDKMVMMIAFKK